MGTEPKPAGARRLTRRKAPCRTTSACRARQCTDFAPRREGSPRWHGGRSCNPHPVERTRAGIIGVAPYPARDGIMNLASHSIQNNPTAAALLAALTQAQREGPEVKRMLRQYNRSAATGLAARRKALLEEGLQVLVTGYKFLKAAIESGLDTAELEQNVARLQAKVDRQAAALTHVIVAMLRREPRFHIHAVRSPAIARIHRPRSSRARRQATRLSSIASAGSGDPPPPPEPARLPGCVGATSAGTGAEVAA